MNNFFKFFFTLVFLGCSTKLTETELLNKKNPFGIYGSNVVSIENNINLHELLKNPEKNLNNEIVIVGEIVDVCPMRGCWIDISDDQENLIKVKVKDGEIVFPLSAINQKVKVYGQFIKLKYTKEQIISWKIHLEEEKGKFLHPDSVKVTELDLIEYRINAMGAEIF